MMKSSFARMSIRGRSLLPVIQGGMGIGISGHRLAGTVAKPGATGQPVLGFAAAAFVFLICAAVSFAIC
jgi:NAD(P)H-dependent flavin oxidoreductase YrpB (nitropropane dioxygenase family)